MKNIFLWKDTIKINADTNVNILQTMGLHLFELHYSVYTLYIFRHNDPLWIALHPLGISTVCGLGHSSWCSWNLWLFFMKLLHCDAEPRLPWLTTPLTIIFPSWMRLDRQWLLSISVDPATHAPPLPTSSYPSSHTPQLLHPHLNEHTP